MEFYLVGGAVRDGLLGLPVVDRDWVVVGATPEAMRDAGFTLKDERFQVYLDPKTGEEYALARRELKTGSGYRGFTVECGPEVSLVTDLRRRDLTLNAIAQDSSGAFIDPFGGLDDLRARTLRHVSEAFDEDPLRFWRAASFSARLSGLGFDFAEATLETLRRMSRSGDAWCVSATHIWTQVRKALEAHALGPFIGALQRIDAFESWPPSVVSALSIAAQSQPDLHAAEQTDPTHALSVLAVRLGSEEGAFLLSKLGAPTKLTSTHTLATDIASALQRAPLSPEDSLDLLQRHDGIRRYERFDAALAIAQAALSTSHHAHGERFEQAARAARDVDLSALSTSTLAAKERPLWVKSQRLAAIRRCFGEIKGEVS